MSGQQSFLEEAWLRGYTIPEPFRLQTYERLEPDNEISHPDLFRLLLRFQGKVIGRILYSRSKNGNQPLWYVDITIHEHYQHLSFGPKLIFAGDAFLLKHLKGQQTLRFCETSGLHCRDFVRYKKGKIVNWVSSTALIYQLP